MNTGTVPVLPPCHAPGVAWGLGPLSADRVDAADATVSDSTNPDEEEANRFARDVLIPPDRYAEFVEAGDFGQSAVTAFAKEQGIPSGVVVGRLQRDAQIPSASYLNKLKKAIHWPQL